VVVKPFKYADIWLNSTAEQTSRNGLDRWDTCNFISYKVTFRDRDWKRPLKSRGIRHVLEKKQNTKVEKLCAGLPVEFATYLNYVRNLGFEDKPDY
jgi:hypothetical protein